MSPEDKPGLEHYGYLEVNSQKIIYGYAFGQYLVKDEKWVSEHEFHLEKKKVWSFVSANHYFNKFCHYFKLR